MSLLSDTDWIGTLHLNVARVLSAAITLTVLYLVGRLTGSLNGPQWENASFVGVLFIPPILLFLGMSFVLFLRLLGSMGVPMTEIIAGLMSLIMIVFIAVGDPLIWVVRKYYPAIVPLQKFNIINPNAVILVQKNM